MAPELSYPILTQGSRLEPLSNAYELEWDQGKETATITATQPELPSLRIITVPSDAAWVQSQDCSGAKSEMTDYMRLSFEVKQLHF